jgi:sugar lactone lactonase YvrE
MPSMIQPKVLLDGLVIGESPRWHDDRLWFAHWGTGQIVAVDLDGMSEVVAEGPPGLGWSIDWLPDGRLLVTGEELMRREPDGSMMRHADLSGIADYGWNEIVVDGRGNIYVNGMAVTPDGSTLIISESFAGKLTAFDIAEDGGLTTRRDWAAGVGPDGVCIDAEGAIWTGSGGAGCVRVREGGEILDRVELDLMPFACMLGGPDGRTLFIMAADWHVGEDPADNMARLTTGPRTGRVLTVQAPAPHAGRP